MYLATDEVSLQHSLSFSITPNILRKIQISSVRHSNSLFNFRHCTVGNYTGLLRPPIQDLFQMIRIVLEIIEFLLNGS